MGRQIDWSDFYDPNSLGELQEIFDLAWQKLSSAFGGFPSRDQEEYRRKDLAQMIILVSGSTYGDDRWLVGLQGVIGVAAGIIALTMPGITALGLLIAIAAWSLVIGVLQIIAAIKLRREIEGELWLGLSGLVSILFGLFIMARPGEGALAVIWLIGAYAIFFGILLIAFAFGIRRAVEAPAAKVAQR